MNTHINYDLGGSFKCDLYNKDGFVSSTDWFSNFITPTGLMMPLTYAFADCFRYLSLGASTTQSSGCVLNNGGLGQTGLVMPYLNYVSTEGSQSAQYIDWRGYATGANLETSACGTVIDLSGPRLFRAWRIPTGGESVFINEAAGGLTIEELMVSPSSGSDPLGKYAFSRVIRNLFIPNGYSTIISYQLRINLKNTGVTIFSGGTFSTGNADTTNDANLVAVWASLSGYYRQVYNGLRYIDALGATYIPKYGDCLEPASRLAAQSIWYLSPDNSQFDVSVSGGQPRNVTDSYNADGLSKSITSLETKNLDVYTLGTAPYAVRQEAYNNDNPIVKGAYPASAPLGVVEANLRVGSDTAGGPCVIPKVNNYKDVGITLNYQKTATPEAYAISYATPGSLGFSSAYADFGKKNVVSSPISKLPIVMTGDNLITGRRKTVTRKAVFSPISSLGYNTRFGSLVYAFNYDTALPAGGKTYFPMIDCLFYDTSGRAQMPHYRFITGLNLSSRGTGILSCHLFLTGNTMGNIYRFVDRNTYRGDGGNLLTHPNLSLIAWQNPEATVFKYSGLNTAGSIDPNAYGYTGILSVSGLLDAGFTSHTGWGSVYGTVVDSGFYDYRYDLGLTDHSLAALAEPTSTGQLYWKTIDGDHKISLAFTGLKYYHPNIGYSFADTGWFGTRNQIIQKIDFEMVNSADWGTSRSNSYFQKSVTGTNNTDKYIGYFLTTKQFDSSVTPDVVAIKDICIGGEDISITGYIISRANAVAGANLKGTVASSVPSQERLLFIPQISGFTLNSFTGCRRVSTLFSGISDRGYPNGTGDGPINSIKPGEILNVLFSGASGTKTAYLTYISGTYNSANLYGHSYLSGVVSITDFCPPIGTPSHLENSGQDYGWRLSPNFTEPTYYGDDIPTINFGGQYPALSLDNGLEMYLTLSWQSNCGSATPCNNPPDA